jgi:hypothetical protein
MWRGAFFYASGPDQHCGDFSPAELLEWEGEMVR